MTKKKKKKCENCGATKPEDAFNEDPQEPDGLSWRCKKCEDLEAELMAADLRDVVPVETKGPDVGSHARFCPDCQMILERGKHFCGKCRGDRRRKTKTQYQRKWRKSRSSTENGNLALTG